MEILQAFHLPLRDPVVVIALATIVFLGAPILFERLRLPATVAFIVAGAVLGPNGLGWLARDETIVLLGTVGLLYLMFMAAVEIDLHDFDRNRARSGFFGILGFLTPQLLGFAVGRALGYGVPASILLGSMLSSHTLLAYPAASRLGIAKNQAVMVAVGATIITDLLALLVLAGISASAQGQLSLAFSLRTAIGLALFAVIVLRLLPAAAGMFFKRSCGNGVQEYVFVLAALFAAAVLAQLAGLEPIIGAFLAGLALNPLLPEGQPLTNRLNFFSDAFFTPFFLFSVGMLVDVRVLAAGPRDLVVMVAMIGTVLPAKWLAAWLTRRRFHYTRDEALTMFGLSVPQAAATLAIALIGFRLRLFDTHLLNATITIILLTSTVGPWLVERYGRRVALGEQRPLRASAEPQRILLPILAPGEADSLVDLALLLRSPGNREPLLPLAVVPAAGRATTAAVAEAEKMLGHAVMRATGAGVNAVPLTRVAYDLASGTGRGIAESRATVVLMAWSGRRDKRRSILNRRLDQIIDRTQRLVLAVSVKGDVKTLQRVVVVLPPGSERDAGFSEAIHAINLVASRLTAEVTFYVVRADVESVRSVVDRVRPAVPHAFEDVPNWFALMRMLEGHTGADTLVVLVGERRGTVAWQRELDRMPRRLAGIAANLCILYPATPQASGVQDDHALTMIGEALQGRRVVAGVPETAPESVIEEVLRTEFRGDSPRLVAALAAVEHEVLETAAEIVPGALLLFGRMSQIAAPLLFLATSEEGIRFPHVSGRARVIVMSLVPSDHRASDRIYLDQLRPIFGNRSRVDDLARCLSPSCIAALFRAEDQGAVPLVHVA